MLVPGRTVEIKCYPRLEGMLDIKVDSAPDYYLVLTGPRSGVTSSRGMIRAWAIEGAYLLETASLVSRLTTKVGEVAWMDAQD